MVANFVHRPLAMIGLIVFLAIFVFVMVGPHIWVLDLSEQDSTLTNLPPSRNMMEVPKALLANGVKDISSGNTYGIGIDNEGELYTWGHTRITDKIDVADIPDEVRSADLVQIAAGTDHVVAVDADGEVYVWGNTRLQQNKFSNVEEGHEGRRRRLERDPARSEQPVFRHRLLRRQPLPLGQRQHGRYQDPQQVSGQDRQGRADG